MTGGTFTKLQNTSVLPSSSSLPHGALLSECKNAHIKPECGWEMSVYEHSSGHRCSQHASTASNKSQPMEMWKACGVAQQLYDGIELAARGHAQFL